MTDEVQKAEAPEAAPETSAAQEQAAYQLLMDGNIPPEKEAAPKDEPKTVPVDAMLDRVARVKRQRDEAREAGYLKDGQLDELREIVTKLRGLKPDDFPTLEAYETAKADLDQRADKLTAPPVPVISAEWKAELDAAAKDLAFEVRRADPDLWAKAVAVNEDGSPKHAIPPAAILAIADADDSAGMLRAWLDLDAEDKEEILGLSERGQRKAIRALQPKPKEAKAKAEVKPEETKPEEKPVRDAATGQFTKRQSAAPEPINPLSGSSVTQKTFDSMSTEEFIAARNAQERADPFGW